MSGADTTAGASAYDRTCRRESPSMATTIARDIGIAVTRAEGCHVWDEGGRRYLDLTAGSGVHALGHRHPAVVAAMHRQVDAYVHGGWQYSCPARAELTDAVLATLPWDDPMLLYCVGGTEAVEAALKVARRATGRPHVLGFLGGYHGKSAGSLAVTANAAFRVGATEVSAATLSLPYPAHPGYLPPDAALRSGHRFGQEILEHPDFGIGQVAAIVVETVQGSGGMNAAAPGALRELRELTARHGILLVVDEIFTGFGRTGTMYGYQHEGVVPDLLVLGKAIGGGLPVALVAGPRSVLSAIGPLQQTSTFAANPVACAAGVAVLSTIVREELAGRAARVGGRLVDALAAVDVPGVRLAVTGRGLMIGIDVRDAPDPDRAGFTRRVVADMRGNGVIALRGGSDGSMIKMTPPLTMPADLADRAVAQLAASLRAVAGARQLDGVRP